MKRESKSIFNQVKSLEFVVNLIILRDILKPIAILSKQLQEKNLNLIDAHKLILTCVQKVKELGNCESNEINDVIRNRQFKGISLLKNIFTEMIDRKEFALEISRRIRERSMSTIYRKSSNEEHIHESQSEYVKLYKFLRLANRDYWPEKIDANFGKLEIEQAADIFKIDKCALSAEFGIYKTLGVIKPTFRKFIDICETFVVASADSERGFSLMNEIITED